MNGRAVHLQRPVTLALHKPNGFVSTRKDPNARDTVFDLVPAGLGRLFNIGRLDAQSEGLLLLTNDGELAQRLTHPRYKIEKEYDVKLNRPWDPALNNRLLDGLFLDGQRASVARIYSITPSHLRIVLRQGINRQIRRMFHQLGFEVKRLVRVRIGTLRLGDLPRGHWRLLTKHEIELLHQARDRRTRQSADLKR